jgi:hypothetical protein
MVAGAACSQHRAQLRLLEAHARIAASDYIPRMAKRIQKRTASILQLKITLDHVEPAIWRRLLVPSDITLGTLHFVLNEAMGWTNSHLHAFALRDRTFGDPGLDPDGELGHEDERKVMLDRLVAEKQSLRYEYDFGDSWEHEVLVEKRLEVDARFHYPLCIGGERACPPEDCGGPPGYAGLVVALADANSAEHDELRTWVGGHFDPEGFDVNRTNQALRHMPVRSQARTTGSRGGIRASLPRGSR